MAITERSASAFENEDIEEFFDNAALSLHWVGPDGTILRANRYELEFLGYSREEYEGHHISEFHVDQDVIHDILARLTRGETLSDYEARMRAKDGSIKYVLINSNVRWHEDKFIHTRCFTRDITAVRMAEQEMRARALELNDDVIQAIVVAKMSFEEGKVEEGMGAMERALQAARSIVGDLLAAEPSRLANFVRSNKP